MSAGSCCCMVNLLIFPNMKCFYKKKKKIDCKTILTGVVQSVEVVMMALLQMNFSNFVHLSEK